MIPEIEPRFGAVPDQNAIFVASDITTRGLYRMCCRRLKREQQIRSVCDAVKKIPGRRVVLNLKSWPFFRKKWMCILIDNAEVPRHEPDQIFIDRCFPIGEVGEKSYGRRCNESTLRH